MHAKQDRCQLQKVVKNQWLDLLVNECLGRGCKEFRHLLPL